MTPMQQRLLEAYTGNIKESAARVGCNYGYARQVVRQAWFKRALAARSPAPTHEEGFTAVSERHIAEYRRIIADRGRIQCFWVAKMLDARVSTRDQLRASELLARSVGLFNETSEGGRHFR